MKSNAEAKNKFFEKGIFAPFRVLKVEKFYLFWIFSFIVSFSSIILDICNGVIASSISQGIFFSTCMAILAPLFFEFLVEYLSLHRKGKKEEYSTYKAWTMAFCFFVLLVLFFFYVTKVKSSLLAQVIVSVIVFVLSFYTYLVSKIRFYSCSNYKGLRGTCESTHYVREDSLEQVVKMELFKLATYLDHDEDAFAELLEHKSNKDSMAERKAAESALAAATARSQELLRLYERVYEDNVNAVKCTELYK